MRVLENQMKLAAGHDATGERRDPDPQMKMPLIVEVKGSAGTKQRARRARGKPRADQSEFGDL